MAAVGGGLALGLVYLGFDLKLVAEDALEYVDAGHVVIDSSSAEEVNSEFAGQSTSSPEVKVVSAVVNKSDTQAKQPSDGRPVATQTPAQEKSTEIAHVEKPAARAEKLRTTAVADPGTATQAYWNALVSNMKEERERRKSIITRSGDWQLFDYLNHRKVNHEKVVAALEAIDGTHVDKKLLAHTQQILAWHQSGVQLYGRVVELLSDNSTDSLDGPAAQSWQSAATQHRMEEKLVQGKHVIAASYLDNSYKSQAPFTPAALR